MNICPVTRIAGALLFRPTPHVDERGFFCRTFDVDVMRAAGIDPAVFAQDSLSRSWRGVVRGLHVRCGARGQAGALLLRAIFDVMVDLRAGSPTYRNWESFELRDEEQVSLYVPAGCAHGFQALTTRRTSPIGSTGRTTRRGRVDRIRRSRTGHPMAASGRGQVSPGQGRSAAFGRDHAAEMNRTWGLPSHFGRLAVNGRGPARSFRIPDHPRAVSAAGTSPPAERVPVTVSAGDQYPLYA